MDECRRYYEGRGGKDKGPIDRILRTIASSRELGRTLDIGCGNGAVLAALAPYSSEDVGVDISAEALALARSRLPDATLVAADVQSGRPFAAASFDCVLVLDVIEHLHDPVSAVSEVRRVLLNGGILAITTPNANSPMRLLKGKSWFGVADPGHILLYTAFTLCYALRKQGFDIIADHVESFTQTPLDSLFQLLRVGGTLFVLAKKSS